MKDVITIDEVLKTSDQWCLIDVRSPSEFSNGHIPGAFNVPLFSDEERARVGTLYKQKSKEAAFKEGLAIAGTKMVDLTESITRLERKTKKKLIIQCWRGGKRSQAVQWLLNFSGAETCRIEGGYKAFRQFLFQFFTQQKFDLRILGGCTGAGKTEILQAIKRMGAQVVDLEGIAHHKGSAFGFIGEPSQPSTEQFENDLFLEFLSLDIDQPIWLENESRSIGRVHIPEGLWSQMRSSRLYAIEVSREVRLERALQYYSEPVDIDSLIHSFEKIRKRLGGLHFQKALEALSRRDLKTAASLALDYYDKAYNFQLENWPKENVMHFSGCDQIDEIAGRLIVVSKEKEKINL